MLRRIFRFFEKPGGLFPPLSFTAVLPKAAFGGRRGGTAPAGRANRQTELEPFTFPRSADKKAERGLAAWQGPRWKMKGSSTCQTILFPIPPVSGNPKWGYFPFLVRGLGTEGPGERGGPRSPTFTLASSTRRRQSLGCANRKKRLAKWEAWPRGKAHTRKPKASGCSPLKQP